MFVITCKQQQEEEEGGRWGVLYHLREEDKDQGIYIIIRTVLQLPDGKPVAHISWCDEEGELGDFIQQIAAEEQQLELFTTLFKQQLGCVVLMH
jgi:hypothetical protein